MRLWLKLVTLLLSVCLSVCMCILCIHIQTVIRWRRWFACCLSRVIEASRVGLVVGSKCGKCDVCVCLLDVHESASSVCPLYALILTPTRELALQTRDHVNAVTKYTDITVRCTRYMSADFAVGSSSCFLFRAWTLLCRCRCSVSHVVFIVDVCVLCTVLCRRWWSVCWETDASAAQVSWHCHCHTWTTLATHRTGELLPALSLVSSLGVKWVG